MSALAGLLLFTAFGAPAPQPKDAKELNKLQGVWKVTAVEFRGNNRAGNWGLPQYTLVVVGGTIKLDPDKHTLDLVATEGRQKGTFAGLYDLAGDNLKIALTSRASGNRPTELKTDQGTHILYLFSRDAAVPKVQAEALLKEKMATLAAQQVRLPAQSANMASTREMLQRIVDRLDRIEQRLGAIEQKLARERK